MTQEEIREHLGMEAPVFGLRPEDRPACILVKSRGVWRQPGASGMKPNELHYTEPYHYAQDFAGNWTMRS